MVRLAAGVSIMSVSPALGKSEQTVANQLRNVYEKLRRADFPEGNVERNMMIAEFAPYFALDELEG